MMSQTFPFKKKKINQDFNQDVYNNNPYPGSGQNNFQNPGFEFPSQGGFGSNPGYPSYAPNKNINFNNNPGVVQDYGNNTNVGFLNPKQSKGTIWHNSAKSQLNDYVSRSQDFITNSQQTTDTLNSGHVKMWSMCQNLHCINRALLE
jgi:hypothetical protein